VLPFTGIWNLKTCIPVSSSSIPIDCSPEYKWNTGILEHWNLVWNTGIYEFYQYEFIILQRILHFICSFYIINFIQIYYFVKSPTWIEIYPLFALNWIALWYSFSVFIISKANYSTGRTLIMLVRIKSHVDLVFQCSKSIPVVFQYSSFQFQWNFHWKPEFSIADVIWSLCFDFFFRFSHALLI
jgi:hypothetical protein